MNLSSQKLPRLIIAVVSATILTLSGVAQTPIPTTNQQGAGIQIGQIKPRPIPQRTKGLDPDKIVRWSLKDAILAALENNVDIMIEKENVRLAEYDLFAARGIYDPTFTSTLSFSPQRTPNAFAFSGTSNKAVTTNTFVYNFGMIHPVEKTGGTFQANFNNNRNSSNTNLLSPAYNPSFSASFTQPLKRNFKTDLNRRQIKISRKRLDLSDATFRQRAIQIIANVQQAYWDLAFAIKDEEIQREAVKLAETQLSNNQRQVEVGTLAPIDVVTAATSVETRRTQVFSAMNAVSQAENTLKQLVVNGPDSEIWNTKIEPAEQFEIQPVNLTIDEAFKLARQNRPELNILQFQKEINDSDSEYFRDQTKPQVDAFASYSIAGLAGEPVDATRVSPDFIGGYPTSLKNLLSNKYPTFRVGVSIAIPWKNKIAEANLGRSIVVGRQLELQVRNTVQGIEAQIRNDLQTIELVRLRVEASRLARDYAQQQLSGEEKRFQAGLSTTFLVLQRQTDLAQAKGTEMRALTDYNKAVAQLQRDIATTLSSNNIEVKSEANPNDEKK